VLHTKITTEDISFLPSVFIHGCSCHVNYFLHQVEDLKALMPACCTVPLLQHFQSETFGTLCRWENLKGLETSSYCPYLFDWGMHILVATFRHFFGWCILDIMDKITPERVEKYVYWVLGWIYPPPSNSGKWRFRLRFPTKNIKTLVVTVVVGVGVDPSIWGIFVQLARVWCEPNRFDVLLPTIYLSAAMWNHCLPWN